MASFTARAMAVLASAALLCACSDGVAPPEPEQPPSTAENPTGKADIITEGPTPVFGACAPDAPTEPYQPVPGPTLAQSEGPEVLHSRIGVPFLVDYDEPSRMVGEFEKDGCGRHYYTFTLDRRAELTISGETLTDGEPMPIGFCFVRPAFLRIDARWYDEIWEREDFTIPCGAFVPNGDRFEPTDGAPLVLEPGAYELRVDHFTVETLEYDVELTFSPLSDAVCGDGVVEGSETCDDGAQQPLDWCGAGCQLQRLDLEPIDGNETLETAQPLDGFRRLRFHATPDNDEIDFYRTRLAAGETVALMKGVRACTSSNVRVFGPDGEELVDPLNCDDMASTVSFTAQTSGEYYLRVETTADGARSISALVEYE